MNTLHSFDIIKANNENRQPLIDLLQSEKLPVDDLSSSLDNFFLCLDQHKLIAAIGLEVYDNTGLLRSMVVDKDYRNQHIASTLVEHLETHARSLNISSLYLLTEAAADFFNRKGFKRISREDAPDAIKRSSEFSHTCPTSAVLMVKNLKR